MGAIYMDASEVIAEVLYGPERGRYVPVPRNQRYHHLWNRYYRLNKVSGYYYLTEIEDEQTKNSDTGR
jgi:hypothetical protein